MEVGGISEVVQVVASRQTGTAARRPCASRCGSVSAARFRQARLLRQPKVVCTDEMNQLGLDDRVSINAILTKYGKLANPIINTVDPRLAQAALDAISRWEHEPTRLNGEPIEVIVKIDV